MVGELKVWMVIWHLGEIGAVAGPLPLTLEQCQVQLAPHYQRVVDDDLLENPNPELAGRITVECIERSTRPIMGEKRKSNDS